MKYNNNGDFVTSWALADPDHRESWSVIGKDDKIYCLFQGETHMGVQTYMPQ